MATLVQVPMIPDMFLVGESPERGGPRRFYVYPFTHPPDDPDHMMATFYTSKRNATDRAARLNEAARRFASYVLDNAIGSILVELARYGGLPGSPESDQAHRHLVALGNAMLKIPRAVAAAGFFQKRLLQERLAGREEALLQQWLERVHSHEMSPN